MPRMLLKGGVLVPLEPLPDDWREGEAIEVERTGPAEPAADDAAWDEIDRLAAQVAPDDVVRMQAALDEHRREAKEWMRRRMGSS